VEMHLEEKDVFDIWRKAEEFCRSIENVPEDELSQDMITVRNIIKRNRTTDERAIEDAIDYLRDSYNAIRHIENNECASAIKKLWEGI